MVPKDKAHPVEAAIVMGEPEMGDAGLSVQRGSVVWSAGVTTDVQNSRAEERRRPRQTIPGYSGDRPGPHALSEDLDAAPAAPRQGERGRP